MNSPLQDVNGGDIYLICYNAKNPKTTLVLNKKELVSIISADLGTVCFEIWLGSVEPINENLRDKLLLNAKES